MSISDRPTEITIRAVMIERSMEQVRQERETFNQRKSQENRWFVLRLVMGYASVVLLPSIMGISSWVLVHNDAFPGTVVAGASAALFVDTLGLVLSVWKIVLNPESVTKLQPVTKSNLPADEERQSVD